MVVFILEYLDTQRATTNPVARISPAYGRFERKADVDSPVSGSCADASFGSGTLLVGVSSGSDCGAIEGEGVLSWVSEVGVACLSDVSLNAEGDRNTNGKSIRAVPIRTAVAA